jgi:hypothetical protein
MRRIVLCTALLLSGFTPVEGRPSGAGGEARFQRLATQLALTPEQRPAVQAILLAGKERRDALHQKRRAEDEAMRAEVRGQLADVLSEAQLQQFEAMRAERRAGGARGGDGRRRHRTD